MPALVLDRTPPNEVADVLSRWTRGELDGARLVGVLPAGSEIAPAGLAPVLARPHAVVSLGLADLVLLTR